MINRRLPPATKVRSAISAAVRRSIPESQNRPDPTTEHDSQSRSRKARPQLGPVDTNRAYPVEEALIYLVASRATFYNEVKAGRIATIKRGARRLVPGSEIARLSQAPAA